MDRNQFLLLNNIIYQIYSIQDFDDMKRNFLMRLQMLIPNIGASILTTKTPGTPSSLCNPICYPEIIYKVEQAYLENDSDSWIRWTRCSGQPMLFRESDMLPEAQRVATSIYQKCYAPFGIHYALQQSLFYRDCYLGAVSIYRARSEEDFSDAEMFCMQALSGHLALVFFRKLMPQGEPETLEPFLHLTRQYHLTNRESEVLRLVFEKRSNEEICTHLFISAHTLKKHMQNIYRKFGVSSRWDLLKYSATR